MLDVGFASPEGEDEAWDFLLFSPSPEHTAALCVQRQPSDWMMRKCTHDAPCSLDMSSDGEEFGSASGREAKDPSEQPSSTRLDHSADGTEAMDSMIGSHILEPIGSMSSSQSSTSSTIDWASHSPDQREHLQNGSREEPTIHFPWKVQNWRTVPLLHERPMSLSETCFIGCS
jgi:hypothetical protein